MATAAVPDDGIPVLTDVVEPAAGAGGPNSRPPNQARAAGGPPSIQTPAPRPTPPAAAPGPANAANGTARAGPVSVTRAPPLSGPPSLSEFPTPPGLPGSTPNDALLLRVHTAVLSGVLARVEPLIEARLKESLADLLEQVLADMTAELKITATNIIRDAVAKSVADELAVLRERNRPPTH